MKSFKILFIFSFVTLVLFSCNKDKDPVVEPAVNEAPSINVASPENHQNYMYSDTIQVSVHFTDDHALDSYHIFIGDEEGNSISGFTFDETGDLHEDHDHVMRSILIPDTAPMVFYIHFDLVDDEGEEADRVTYMQHVM